MIMIIGRNGINANTLFSQLSRDRQNLPFFMADAIGIFQEEEGTTLILSRNRADADKLNYSSVFRLITLSVHSSLDAVGFFSALWKLG